MRTRPTDPLKFTTLDGVERTFLITLGTLRRIRNDAAKRQAEDGLETYLSLIFHAQYPQPGAVGDMDSFADLFPADMGALMEFAGKLQEASGLSRPNESAAAVPPTTEEPPPQQS